MERKILLDLRKDWFMIEYEVASGLLVCITIKNNKNPSIAIIFKQNRIYKDDIL
jgi:hypothetical protein